jgi:hypothetical protein
MLCPNCNRDSPDGNVCSFCGTSGSHQSPGVLSGDPFSKSPKFPPTRNSKSLVAGILTVAAWIAAIFLNFLRTSRWSGGVFNAESLGYFVGSLAVPALITLLVLWLMDRRRAEGSTVAHKHLVVAAWTVFFSFLGFAGEIRRTGGVDSSSVKDHVRHLFLQATNKEADSGARWYDGPSRDFFRDAVTWNQEYTKEVQLVDQTFVAKLYSPESYATRANLQATISALQVLQQVDKKYESLDPLVKKLELNVNAAQASDREKADFLRGVHSSLDKSLGPRNETFKREEEWLQSSVDLYQFALSHFSDYSVRKDKLVFHRDASRLDFVDRQSKSIALRKATVESRSRFNASRKEIMSQIGLAPSEVPSQPAVTK